MDGRKFVSAAHKPRQPMHHGRISDLVIQHKVVVAGQQNAAADVLGERIRRSVFPRHDLHKLATVQVVERTRQYILAYRAKLSVLEDTEVRAEVRVGIAAVTTVFRAVEAIRLSGGEEIQRAASSLPRPAPAIV